MKPRLILMLKFPEPGKVKTRLIPVLGKDRACSLYRTLAEGVLAQAKQFAERGSVEVEAWVDRGPSDLAVREWLGYDLPVMPQGDGDLGLRMSRAAQCAFEEGAPSVMIIGGDCPELTSEIMEQALEALERVDLVLGPAADGGYYLLGMKRFEPSLFQAIDWSTSAVRAQTLGRASRLRMTHQLLEPLRDIDEPDDLPSWAFTDAAERHGKGRISVIIPTLNEASALAETLQSVVRGDPHEVIVVDGGSLDDTVTIAHSFDTIVQSCLPGRAGQMNTGASVATGEFLLFLHADTQLPDGYSTHIRSLLDDPKHVAGAFRFSVGGTFRGKSWLERGTNLRTGLLQLPYGDQGLFIRRQTFQDMMGYELMPIMEDYELVRRLRRKGKIAVADVPVITSGRRWEKRGWFKTTLLNQLMIIGYHIGTSSGRLARWYRGSDGPHSQIQGP